MANEKTTVSQLDLVRELILNELQRGLGQGVAGSYLVELSMVYNNLK